LAIAKLLIEKGADVKATDHLGRTPLHALAALPKHNDDARKAGLGVAEMLLAKGADWRVQDKFGKTALEVARMSDYQGLVSLLSSREETSHR
jgi:ankyrin repeat protein